MANDPVTMSTGPLATPVEQAVRVAATAYAQDPSVDVEHELREELAARGGVLDDGSVQALARAVRAGRSEELVADAFRGPESP